ncbi:MAG: alpha/beta hydrolase [Alphaproteobacteria bacterium]
MAITEAAAYSTEEHIYTRHGDRALKIHLFKPAGDGPHPVIVDLHGGCWNSGNPAECAVRDAIFAGIAAASVEFRQAADRYPSSPIDVNAAIRWIKAHAGELGLDAGRVGILGQSSGGHLAALAAMRPGDPRYTDATIEGGGDADATVRCVGMMWPVINPLSRYRRVCGLRAAGDPPKWVSDLPERHDIYWVTEANMEEANPMLALERGEPVETPPAIWFQGEPDPVHDYRDPESPLDLNEPQRFAENYRKAGGHIDIVYVPQPERSNPDMLEPLVAFFREHL